MNLSRLLFDNITQGKRYTFRLIEAILDGEYGHPNINRLDLVRALIFVSQNKVNKGDTLNTVIKFLNDNISYFRWLISSNKSFDLEAQRENYFIYELHLSKLVKDRKLTSITKYDYLLNVARLVDAANEFIESRKDEVQSNNIKSIFFELGLEQPKHKRKRIYDLNVSDTQKLARCLAHLYLQIDTKAIHGQLPFEIEYDNKTLTLKTNISSSFDDLKEASLYKRRKKEKNAGRAMLSPSNKLSDDQRWVFVNLKRNIFFMMFVIATGGNKSTVLELRRNEVKRLPAGNDQTIYNFKNRAGHIVPLTIFNNFKPLMDDYISFRDTTFSGEYQSKWLFPMIYHDGVISDNTVPLFRSERIKSILIHFETPWQPPRLLRRTYVNWINRYSDNDQMTAAMAGHDVETFYKSYFEPNHQRAVVEILNFHKTFDPKKLSVIGGQCEGKPESIETIPSAIAKPNCILPTGCLFCEAHLHVESAEYVWNLTTFRFLKHLEAAYGYLDKDNNISEPTDATVNKITFILEEFKDKHADWVSEALDRVHAGDFHPNWVDAIDLINGF